MKGKFVWKYIIASFVFISITLPLYTKAAYPFGDEVVLYHFEDAATATSTNSGTGGSTYDGTFFGNASTTAAQKLFGSKSSDYGETNDYMKTYYGTGINPTTQSISVSLWAYKGTNNCTSDDDHIFGVSGSPTNNRFYIRCKNSTTNKWGYRIQGNAEVFSTNSVSTTSWDHIVLVANAATDQTTFYVNGVAIGSPTAYTSFTLSGNFYVGNYNDTVASDLSQGGGAYIDEVAIYDRALTGSEVTEMYQAGQLSGQVGSLAATGYDQKAYVSWTAGSGTTTHYLVEYKLNSTSTWSTFGTTTSTNTFVTGLTNNTAYDFRVTSYNNLVAGVTSGIVTTIPVLRNSFVSPTPSQSSTINASFFTAAASSTLPTASNASSTHILRLETAGGALVSQVSTTTRYGDYNITHMTNIIASKDMTLPSSASGAVYVPTTNTIFIPHNVAVGADTTISEVDVNGDAISRTITCTACGDVEGITLISSTASTTAPGVFDHVFMISTENSTSSGRVFRVTIPSTGNVTINASDFFSTGIVHGTNTGLEGIAYNSSTGVFYLAEEDATETLYEGVITGPQTMTTSVICSNLTWPGSVTDFSDLYYKDNTLYVLTELAGSALIPVNITSTSSCSFIDSDGDGNTTGDTGDYLTSIPVGGTDQAEGVTFDTTGGYLYVIGEADFFAKYRTNVFTTQHTFTGLTSGNYVLKSSFIDTNGVVSSSSDRAFTVSIPSAPSITTNAASSVTTDSAILNATLDSEGGASTTASGFEYGLTTAYGATLLTGGYVAPGAFYNTATGLTPNTLYHFRAFVVNSIGTASSSDMTFTTAVVPSSGGSSPAPVQAVGPIGGGGGAAAIPWQLMPQQPAVQPQVPQGAQGVLQSPIGQGVLIKNIQAAGKKGPDIKLIQRLLNADPKTRVAAIGAGSPGKETDLYGPATRAAVQKFQLKHGIVKSPRDQGYGVVGPKTRAKMNELLRGI